MTQGHAQRGGDTHVVRDPVSSADDLDVAGDEQPVWPQPTNRSRHQPSLDVAGEIDEVASRVFEQWLHSRIVVDWVPRESAIHSSHYNDVAISSSIHSGERHLRSPIHSGAGCLREAEYSPSRRLLHKPHSPMTWNPQCTIRLILEWSWVRQLEWVLHDVEGAQLEVERKLKFHMRSSRIRVGGFSQTRPPQIRPLVD
ncbi:unnamed protein product [Mesocestoides corti]|uniref:Uncharacterized protein n=1 Tax=Mesocestoides corti TaxID=53468 RepID=A0A158QVS3_MESCO|nr:unnamed protein product [Mesocestoides corti]